jgi:signal transduction histidine kinase
MTTRQEAQTQFAPAERADKTTIDAQRAKIQALALCCELLDAVPTMAMVINRQRQILYANGALLDFLGAASVIDLAGLRPGEAVGCVNSRTTAGGCGTTEACRACGAFIAMLRSIDGERASGECCIVRQDAGRYEALDLWVWAIPMTMAGERVTVVSFVDTASEKRREALERVFFHDVLNIAGALSGGIELLEEKADNGEELTETLRDLEFCADQLLGEIKGQRLLAAAESGHLQPAVETVRSRELMASLARSYVRHTAARGKTIAIDPGAETVAFSTDPVILGRVMGNLITNALEASTAGQTVTVSCRSVDSQVEFSVHNAGAIPEEARPRVFRPAFSTKEAGRGLGTYSVKLLTENYLKGAASFTSSNETGTTFVVRYPLAPNR